MRAITPPVGQSLWQRHLPNGLLAIYVVNACLHVLSLVEDWVLAERMTKPLITVVLAALVLCRWAATSRSAGVLTLAALCLSLGGDVLLQADSARHLLPAIGLFACAHIAYAGAFRTLPPPARRVIVVLVSTHLVVWAGMNAFLWSRLEVGLGLAVLAYSALLLAMAALSWRAGWTAGAGGICFVASDAALAFRDFAGVGGEGIGIFVIVSYIAAQGLIVTSLSRRR